MDDALIQRVDALERAVTDGDHDLTGLATEAEALDRLDRLDDQYDDLETRVAELEAATQALRGYVGNVRAVNEEVETRAETALAKVQALETAVQTGQPSGSSQANEQANGRYDADTGDAGPRTAGTPDSSTAPSPQSDNAGLEHASATGGSVADGGGVHRESPRCTACGQARPEADRRRNGDANRGDDGHSTADTDQNAPEKLRERDPLVADGAEDDAGTLSRFKQLL